MKYCSEDCEYIGMSHNKFECLAQKNMPYVELGDECTADCKEGIK